MEELRQVRKECGENLPDNIKHDLRDFKYSKDEKVMKYIHCVAEKLDIFGENGFDYEKMADFYSNKITKEELKEIADPCLKEFQRKDYSNHEELAYHQWTCMIKDNKFKQLFQKNAKN